MAEPRLTALLVDDEPPARDLLRLLCEEHDIAVVGEAADGAAALALLETVRPDLLLLDIAMPGIDGLTVARKLFGQANTPAIVFTTAFAKHAVAAFDIAAADYLLKPIDPARFMVALDRVRSMRADLSLALAGYIWVPHHADLVRVELGAIERVEAERDYVRLYVAGRSHLLRETMDGIESRLPAHLFSRLHRSTIIRRDMLHRLRHEGGGVWSAVLEDGTSLRIGRSYLDKVRKCL